MAAKDEARISEIRAWFDERGYDLYVHEIEGHGWRAPYILKNSSVGSADYGVGDTPIAAAEDARARFDSRTLYVHDEARMTEHAVVVKVEGTEAPSPAPLDLPSLVRERALGDPHVASATIETLTAYGWTVVFEDEPDGKVTGHLLDRDSGHVLKSALGRDFHDAWLELGIDTLPPSDELRREREKRRAEPAPE